MKIKSKVWQWLALACGCVGLLYGLGVEGVVQTGGDPGGNFTTAVVLVLLALLALKLSFIAQDREEREARKAHRKPANTVKQNRRMGA